MPGAIGRSTNRSIHAGAPPRGVTVYGRSSTTCTPMFCRSGMISESTIGAPAPTIVSTNVASLPGQADAEIGSLREPLQARDIGDRGRRRGLGRCTRPGTRRRRCGGARAPSLRRTRRPARRAARRTTTGSRRRRRLRAGSTSTSLTNPGTVRSTMWRRASTDSLTSTWYSSPVARNAWCRMSVILSRSSVVYRSRGR